MADLFEFPYEEGKDQQIPFAFKAEKMKVLKQVEHSFTRYRVKLYPSLWRAEKKVAIDGYEWISWKEMGLYPFSSGHRKILQNLETDDAHITH